MDACVTPLKNINPIIRHWETGPTALLYLTSLKMSEFLVKYYGRYGRKYQKMTKTIFQKFKNFQP